MPIWKYSGIGSGLLAFLMGTVMPFHKAEAQTAGTVGSVNTDASGTAPGQRKRSLSVGQNVVQNERIETNENGTAHIVFNDRSALNIGRNSNVVIDTFVYNASAGKGDMAVSLARGAARFVGGQVSHTTGAVVRTPAASIGIRGGNITVSVVNGTTTVFVHNGVANVSNTAGQQSVRAGLQVTVGAGQPPSPPTTINLGQLRQVTSQLASGGNQTGGAIIPPQDSDAQRNSIGIPRAPVTSPNFDLPAAGDDLLRGATPQRRIYPGGAPAVTPGGPPGGPFL